MYADNQIAISKFFWNVGRITAMKTAAHASLSSKSVRLTIREIVDADIHSIINLLERGFPNRRRYWELGLSRLQTRSVPLNMPRYGYLLEAELYRVALAKHWTALTLCRSYRRIRTVHGGAAATDAGRTNQKG